MKHFKLVQAAFLMIFLVAIFDLAKPAVSQTNPISLGLFSLLNEGYPNANGLTVLYGTSSEGDPLITYYPSPADMNVILLSNGQYEIVETLGGRCMTSNGLGSTVTITSCVGNSNQLFSLNQQLDGSYVTKSTDGYCIGSPGPGTAVETQTCHAGLSQNWIFSGVAPLSFGAPTTTTSPATTTGTAATTAASTTINSITVMTSSPPATSAATTASSLGIFSILNGGYSNANALTVLYGASSEGDPLITYNPSPADMNVVSLGDGQYEIVETLGGRCMTANGLGATVTITTCAGNSNQIFALSLQSGGTYLIQSTGSACISSPGGGTAIEAQICDADPGQNWIFSGNTPLNLGTTTSNSTPSAVLAGYHLTFDDEFQSLNISDANGAGTNWYTHTIQCCLSDSATPPAPTYMAGLSYGPDKNPYSLLPGLGLDIRLQKTDGAWYSGVLATVDGTGAGFSQQYGYFEMKANFPSGLGTWPAFWLLNSAHLSQGAPSGEIDVVEAYMQYPTIVDTTLHDYSNSTSVGLHQATVANMSNGFHTYGMLWTASTMTFYFDGAQIWQIPTPTIMNQPYYPIIDLGLGGGFPTDQTPQQSDMIVRYVRVYAP